MNKKTIEMDLVKYKDLGIKIKSLEKDRESVKKELIANYFYNHTEYRTDAGIIIATYSSSYPITFQSNLLKEIYPDIYEQFLDMKEQKRLLVK